MKSRVAELCESDRGFDAGDAGLNLCICASVGVSENCRPATTPSRYSVSYARGAPVPFCGRKAPKFPFGLARYLKQGVIHGRRF